MTKATSHLTIRRVTPGPQGRACGFTLVELLTVMFIISVLIGILIPSLNAARNSAKKTATKATLSAVGAALDLFRGENQRDFARTNGYPPSFAHPRIVDASGNDVFDGTKGEFPFIKQKPIITGAHWLPMMLMGLDQQGYIKRGSVPKKDDLRYEPWKWYEPDAVDTGKIIDRAPLYIDPGNLKTVRTQDLPGQPNLELFGDTGWEYVRNLPVITDHFGQPILYYVANANGKTTNMLEDVRKKDNKYVGEAQAKGPPFYFHQDNLAFTGEKDAKEVGWDFDGEHPIAETGAELTAAELVDPTDEDAQNSFARFIIDRTILRTLETKRDEEGQEIVETTPLRPVNPDTYLLICAGVDGQYGTSDDITNFPLALE